MILSVSRRTDIPSYYSDWFLNRIKEGYLYVRNPFNPHQISKINLSTEVIDCIVFWTKNPKPMIEKLDELRDYHYYFQFTLTGYGSDIEKNIPHKKEEMIPIFQELSKKIGKEKVIWRYDPILFTEKYSVEYHLKAFEQIAKALRGYTEKCVISFIDVYAKNKNALQAIHLQELCESDLKEFAAKLSKTARENQMEIATCAEELDLTSCGIVHNSCIDRELIEKIIGCPIHADKDKNQRSACGCVESIEVGIYDSCKNGCIYCYANHSLKQISSTCDKYDANSPLLCGVITEEDKITERKMKSLREEQLRLPNLR